MNANIKALADLVNQIETLMKVPEGDWKGGVALGACRDELRELVSAAGIHARYIQTGLDEVARHKALLADAQTYAEHIHAKNTLKGVQQRYALT